MRILITGSAGFVGSHLVDHLLAKTDHHIIGLDSFKHRGDSLRVQNHERYQIYGCDLSCPVSDRLVAKLGEVDVIINMASESHVDRSISDPVPFIQNNVNLAIYVLEMARKLKPKHFIQISTDEVYGAAIEGMDHKEWYPILPSNPYSASKASQEAIAISYWRTFGVPLTISNTMNMFGERQDREKFIPMCIGKILRNERVTIHGNRDYIGTRKYLHARNHADALVYLINKAPPKPYVDNFKEIQMPDRFNIVGDVEVDNLALAKMIAEILGKDLNYELVDFHALTTRPGHDRRYSLDGTKMLELGWTAPLNFQRSLENTVRWYVANQEWLR